MADETASYNEDVATVAPEVQPPPPATAPAPEGRVRWLTLLKYAVIAIVAMFLLLVLFDKVIMPWYVKLGSVETVPNVVGLSFADAQRRLEKLEFEVKKGEPRFDDRFAAGTVIMQLPYAGQQTKQGRRVYLTLSRGTELIPMPDLTGMPLREARITLMRNGFDIGEITYEHNDTIMKELLYSQSIPPKVPTRPGAVINVMISRGPSTRFTMMPNLISLDVDMARTHLENAGLVLGVVKYKEAPGYAKNTIIEQGVSPYAQVAQGAAVDVTIVGTPDPSETSVIGDEGGSPLPPAIHNAKPEPVRHEPPKAASPKVKPHPAKPKSAKSAPTKPKSGAAKPKPAQNKSGKTEPTVSDIKKPAPKPKPKPKEP